MLDNKIHKVRFVWGVRVNYKVWRIKCW
jgi:hypothetical protein